MNIALTRKLEPLTALSEEEKRLLAEAASQTRTIRPGQDVAVEGDRPGDCSLLLDGFACRYKVLPDGKRQIIGFLIAGDLCDLTGFVLGRMDHSVAAVSAAEIAVIPHRVVQELVEQHPRIARALWQETLMDASISREWVVNVGRRSARERIAHVLSEVGMRLKVAGRAENGSFEWPFTQAELADATGLSTVHVNRVLQELRGEGLIRSSGKTVVVQDWGSLNRAGAFRPDYLFTSSSDGNQGPGKRIGS